MYTRNVYNLLDASRSLCLEGYLGMSFSLSLRYKDHGILLSLDHLSSYSVPTTLICTWMWNYSDNRAPTSKHVVLNQPMVTTHRCTLPVSPVTWYDSSSACRVTLTTKW